MKNESSGAGTLSDADPPMYFETSENFYKALREDIESCSLVAAAVPGQSVGVSIRVEYPKNGPYKPPMNSRGLPDRYIEICLFYEHSDQSIPFQECDSTGRVPVTAVVAQIRRYRQNKPALDFSDPDCPTEVSLALSKRSVQPRGALWVTEYWSYDHFRNCLIDNRGERVTVNEVVAMLVERHLASPLRLKYLFKRLRKRAREIFYNLIFRTTNVYQKAIQGVLGFIFDVNANPYVAFRESGDSRRMPEFEKQKRNTPGKSYQLHGIHASVHSIALSLIIGLPLLFFALRLIPKEQVWSYQLLVSTGGFIAWLLLFNYYLPRFLYWTSWRVNKLKWAALDRSMHFTEHF